MSGLAYELWASRPGQSLEEKLRTDPEFLATAKENGWFAETIARIEAEGESK